MRTILFILLLTSLIACNTSNKPTQQTHYPADPHSYSRPSEAIVKHLDLAISVNFDEKTLTGLATMTIENHGAKQLFLDTKMLTISEVWISDGKSKQPTKFAFGENDSIMGKALIIDIEGNTNTVAVSYTTSPKAEGLQWLNAQQTADKKSPFLFSQSEAILARTWVPIQDAPAIRFTYSATVRVPKDFMAVMSASNPQQKSADGIYHFEMKQPIPAYLLALAVGDIGFQLISDRVGVYAEKSMLSKSAWELQETEKMVELAEGLYGKYAWERYDVIILPPSFPFGGMENPRLTFATPTIIAGDRSLVTLVAHELAHSWSGNLVTNATWDDFWLNEGFTVYFEYRIMEALKGREYSEMLAYLSYEDLEKEIEGLDSADTRLKLNLKGRNPDDGMNDIAYNKGYYFLRLIEESVGRTKWDTFLKQYFQENAFSSMTTERFLEKLKGFLSEEEAKKININAWVYSAGIPANCPKAKPKKLEEIDAQIALISSKGNWMDIKTAGWSTNEWVHFISHLPEKLSLAEMEILDKTFSFTNSKNAEIQYIWYGLAIQHQYKTAYPAMENFLIEVGRRKYLKPLYKAMIQTPEGKKMAIAIFQKARANYHSISVNTIAEMLGVE